MPSRLSGNTFIFPVKELKNAVFAFAIRGIRINNPPIMTRRPYTHALKLCGAIKRGMNDDEEMNS